MTLLGITLRAAQEIERLMKTLPEETNPEKYLPSISWQNSSSDPGFVPGPCIGVHEKTDVADAYIIDAHGLKVAFNLSDDLLAQYQEFALDFFGGRFIFVDKKMSAFIGNSND
jgi:hypothetical protein